MKTIRNLLTAVAVAFTAILPVSAQEADKAALDAFKKEMQAIETFSKEEEAKLKDNPMGGIAMIRGIVGKVQAVKTDGLPADLKTTYGDFSRVLGKMGEMFKEWPAKVEDIQAYVEKKAKEDPKFMEDFGSKMEALETEMNPITAKLDELGKKYGLEELSNIAPGK